MTDAAEPVPVITIDGPGGAGKGSVAGEVARELGWHLLDSGALYRTVGLLALARGVALDDAGALANMTRSAMIRFTEAGVVADDEELGNAIRSDEVAAAASRVAALPPVRAALLDVQRELRRAPGLVADGRDTGTVVFPDAPVKIFLVASVEERARRRLRQLRELKQEGAGDSVSRLSESIRERDERDRNRSAAPLVPAADAVTIDSTHLSIAAVVERVLALWEERAGRLAAGPGTG